MLFFIKAKVHQKDLSMDQLWELWEKEAQVALPFIESGKIAGAYKVAGQRRVILLYDASSHEEIDRVFMAGLPLAEYLELEEILPVRSYTSFANDVGKRWNA